ncbi:hypothetical protein A3K86_04330 [Photobacterium jeanii]|uniref:Uncharacterized protein n=1 Tax=Photobacterium jeanii TaxID=858640 RepID=A0A178KMA5_9GAMM|nr:hypothetical protein [Photobacterium jeanii]OAN18135.1 hypothetical protein A3K86_04330 [Photobacterium jeanii]PST92189.1 hypothetical protein C9I91_03145 [Photobacterium jeanii]
MKTKLLMLAAVMSLTGCEAYNMVQAGRIAADYNILAGQGAAVFNSQNGSQYLIPKPYNEEHPRMLVCYTNGGLFGSKDEAPLRDVGNEYLEINRPGFHLGEGVERSGTWDSRTCYDFEIQPNV